MKQFEIDQMTTDQIKRLDDDKPFDYKWLTLDDYLKVIPGGSQEEISKKSHKCFCPLHEIGRNHKHEENKKKNLLFEIKISLLRSDS